MNADDRIALVRKKIERAEKHIEDVKAAISEFVAEVNPYRFGIERHPKTGQEGYVFSCLAKPPDRIAIIAGDAIHNLRSALDHLAYQLVLAGLNIDRTDVRINFPIREKFGSPEKFEAFVSSQVQGARPDAIKAICALEPYKGGNEHLWMLHRLDNIDKHRVLFTTGAALSFVSRGPLSDREMIDLVEGRATEVKHAASLLLAMLKPAQLIPLKEGKKLFIPFTETEANMNGAFDIAFNEPQVAECQSILVTLRQMAQLINGIVPSFRPWLT